MENAKELVLMDCNNLDELLDVEFGKVGTASKKVIRPKSQRSED